ncbi:MAG: hypothetical protein IJ593_02365, partial [Lachnospiraceae bacterium]|nr:hypothetical protein [Lachnospiraceae bacterium]
DKILNDKDNPIKGFKLCLNGHTIRVESKKDFLALCGDCSITDCQATHGTIAYATPSEVTGSLFNLVATTSTINNFGIYGKNDTEIEFTNVAINNDNQAFITGFNDKDELHLEYVNFNNNNIKSSLFETKGTTALDHVTVEHNTFERASASIISMKEPETGTTAQNVGQYLMRGGEYSYNTVCSKDSAIVSIEAKNANSKILLQNDDNVAIGEMNVSYNKVSNYGAFKIGSDEISKTVFNMRGIQFANNTANVASVGAGVDYKGVCVNLKNIYGDTEADQVSISECDFNKNGVGIENTSGALDYTRASDGSNKVYGAGMYIEGTTKTTTAQKEQMIVRDCTFTFNTAYEGGAIYIKNARGITIGGDNTELRGNYGKEGSLLYIDDSDSSIKGKSSININYLGGKEIRKNGVIFENNSYNSVSGYITDDRRSKSMIYFSAIGVDEESNPIKLNVESPRIIKNSATEGIFKFGNCDNHNSLRFYGDDADGVIAANGVSAEKAIVVSGSLSYEPKHYGGPVIGFANDVGYNPTVELFESAEGRKLTIELNWAHKDANAKSAIVSGLKDVKASSSIVLYGKVVIRDNFIGTVPFSEGEGREANIRVIPSMTFTADESFD